MCRWTRAGAEPGAGVACAKARWPVFTLAWACRLTSLLNRPLKFFQRWMDPEKPLRALGFVSSLLVAVAVLVGGLVSELFCVVVSELRLHSALRALFDTLAS